VPTRHFFIQDTKEARVITLASFCFGTLPSYQQAVEKLRMFKNSQIVAPAESPAEA